MNSCLARTPPDLAAMRGRNQEPPPSPHPSERRRTRVTPQRPPPTEAVVDSYSPLCHYSLFKEPDGNPLRIADWGSRIEPPATAPFSPLPGSVRNPQSGFRNASWWSRWDSNPRPPGCKPGALPAELRPLAKSECGNRKSATPISHFRFPMEAWWAQVDSNHRPRPYQGRALAG